MKQVNLLIKEKTSYDTVEVFKYLREHYLNKCSFYKAEVNYDVNRLNDESDPPEKWTLQLYADIFKISVYGLTAGYGGTGPLHLKEILDLCGEFENTDRVLKEGFVTFFKKW